MALGEVTRPLKLDEARDLLAAALRGGAWPKQEIVELISLVANCNTRTVERAATDLGVVRVRRIFWVSKATAMTTTHLPIYLEGHTREQLIRRIVSRQEPSAATSEHSQREAHLDEIRELMDADEVYVPDE